MDQNNDNLTDVNHHLEGKKPHKKGGASRKKHQTARSENFRREIGKKVNAEIDAQVKRDLIPGIKDEKELLERIKSNAAKRAQMLSVTTRGVGLALSTTVYTSVSYAPEIRTPNIYALYRVALATFEGKVRKVQNHYPINARFSDHCAMLKADSTFEAICNRVTILPEPIKKIIDAVGIVTCSDDVFLPFIPKDRLDKKRRFVPQAENVYFGNLRRVVEALSDVATPLPYRRHFRERCCIPGTIWNDDLLQNPDEIMPPGFSNDMLQRDALMINPWLCSLQKYAPKFVKGAVATTPQGRKSIFLSNGMETVRIPERRPDEDLTTYCSRCIPEGNIKVFQSKFDLVPAEQVEGALCLLGERPDYENFKLPSYVHRLEEQCGYEFSLNWLSATQIFYSI